MEAKLKSAREYEGRSTNRETLHVAGLAGVSASVGEGEFELVEKLLRNIAVLKHQNPRRELCAKRTTFFFSRASTAPHPGTKVL